MAARNALFCESVGNTSDTLSCCYPDDSSSPPCYDFITDTTIFSERCPSGDCVSDCQNPTQIYRSSAQDTASEGYGRGPIRRFQTCVNLPNVAGYLLQPGVLETNISSRIVNVSTSTTDDDLKRVTHAVTECLTYTCWRARHRKNCEDPCAAVNLFVNSTTPDIQGIDHCLSSLCMHGYDSLPFADVDVIGIGVFTSYITQCIIVVLLWFGLSGFEYYHHHHRRRKHPEPSSRPERRAEKAEPAQSTHKTPLRNPKGINHHSLLADFLVQFHKTQCYFSATLQIASLSYGIFETDMLVTFMLTPIATNGVLPIVFVFTLLLRCGKASLDITLLTTVCWLLSSIVYWTLYANIIPINQDFRSKDRKYRAYQQFMYKLSAFEPCGGYSALAVCPENLELGKSEILKASDKLSVLTPLIWSFSTICLLVTLAFKLRRWLYQHDSENTRQRKSSKLKDGKNLNSEAHHPIKDTHTPPFLRSKKTITITYVLMTMAFLAGMGMQLSLLSIGTSLRMMNGTWSFGQIVAVTIWAPPLLGYAYCELKKMLKERRHRGQ